MKYCAVILAAGDGSRLQSNIPKPLVKINNKSIIQHIVDTFSRWDNIDIIVIVKKNSPIINSINQKCKFIIQDTPNGTGHAIKCAIDTIKKYDQTFISVGDSPLISFESLKKMNQFHIDNNIDCSFLTSKFPKKFPYAAIVRDANNKIIKCVEPRDANKLEKQIDEKLSSHYLIKSKAIIDYIEYIKPNVITKEEYLTDIINILIDNQKSIYGLKVLDYMELVGINTPQDLEEVKRIIDEK